MLSAVRSQAAAVVPVRARAACPETECLQSPGNAQTGLPAARLAR